jgi:hypothetical protein
MIKMGLTDLLSQITDYKDNTSITNIYFNIHHYNRLIIFGKVHTLDFNRIIIDCNNRNILFNFINFVIRTSSDSSYVEFIYAVNEV